MLAEHVRRQPGDDRVGRHPAAPDRAAAAVRRAGRGWPGPARRQRHRRVEGHRRRHRARRSRAVGEGADPGESMFKPPSVGRHVRRPLARSSRQSSRWSAPTRSRARTARSAPSRTSLPPAWGSRHWSRVRSRPAVDQTIATAAAGAAQRRGRRGGRRTHPRAGDRGHGQDDPRPARRPGRGWSPPSRPPPQHRRGRQRLDPGAHALGRRGRRHPGRRPARSGGWPRRGRRTPRRARAGRTPGHHVAGGRRGAPAWTVEPTELQLEYTDGTFVGYRGFHAGRADAPAHWLGAGEGYGSWEYAAAALGAPAPDGSPTVAVTVANTGGPRLARAGAGLPAAGRDRPAGAAGRLGHGRRAPPGRRRPCRSPPTPGCGAAGTPPPTRGPRLAPVASSWSPAVWATSGSGCRWADPRHPSHPRRRWLLGYTGPVDPVSPSNHRFAGGGSEPAPRRTRRRR